MNKTRKILTRLLLLSVVMVIAAVTNAATEPAEKLMIAWSAVSGSQAPFWIAKEAGFFEKNGLGATMIYIDGGSMTAQALMSGDVPIAQIGGNAPVVARLRGMDLTMIAGVTNILAYSLIVNPDIKKPQDLRGKKLAVSRFGSNSDYATRKILLKWGLKPDVDVAILQIPGGQLSRLAAVQSKQINGLVAQPPVTNLARKFNLKIIAEPEDFGGAYPTTTVVARVSYIKDNRDTVRKFTRALVEAIHFYKTHKEFSKNVIGKYVKTADNEALEDSYQFFAPLVPTKPYPTLEGIKEALMELGEKDSKARAARPEDFADMSFVKELDESGYIDGLYKKK
jgi:ABC-type nitrate/sulfonate/bicarbonate transport system substrate-binding protein